MNESIQPIYQTFPSWKAALSGIKSFDQIEGSLHKYVQFVEKYLDTPIRILSTGPERQSLIDRKIKDSKLVYQSPFTVKIF